MTQPLFPSTSGTQSRFAYFLTVKAVVRKFGKSDGQTGSRCLDKAVLPQGGGGGTTVRQSIGRPRPPTARASVPGASRGGRDAFDSAGPVTEGASVCDRRQLDDKTPAVGA